MKKIFLPLAVILLTVSCKQKTEVPLEVTSDDMMALFNEKDLDIDRIADYSVAFINTYEEFIDESMKSKTAMSDSALLAENTTASEVLKKLNLLKDKAEGEARFNIDRTSLKLKKLVSRADTYLNSAKTPPAVKSSKSDDDKAPSVNYIHQVYLNTQGLIGDCSAEIFFDGSSGYYSYYDYNQDITFNRTISGGTYDGRNLTLKGYSNGKYIGKFIGRYDGTNFHGTFRNYKGNTVTFNF